MSYFSDRVKAPTFGSFSLRQPTSATPFSQDDEEEEVRPGYDFSRFANQQFGPATQKYLTHIQSAPKREEYAPSKWRRLAAALSGLGKQDSFSAARQVVDDPYNTAMDNWGTQGQGMQEAAKLETDDSQNRLKMIMEGMKAQDVSQRGWYDSKSRRTTAENSGRNITSQIAEREALTPVRVDDYKARTRGTNYNTDVRFPAQVKNDAAKVSQGWSGLANESRRLAETEAENQRNHSMTDPRNILGLLGASASFTRANRGPAPSYMSPTDDYRSEKIVLQRLVERNPALKDAWDPETFTLDYEALDPAEAASIKAKLPELIAQYKASLRR